MTWSSSWVGIRVLARQTLSITKGRIVFRGMDSILKVQSFIQRVAMCLCVCVCMRKYYYDILGGKVSTNWRK